ncbi:MAG: MFS transporter [Proteobacteria bacterium]|nr:MFS transporter [Pseudomonadota bacterium]MBU1585559.1 MFS transporter [Pseudomonadota bacterium]MBU2454796.1 MFS transporter [Pseudomonadota bacterium]MBU2630978.1 MFS transporter [Pseudomonadota bacterium]
MSQAIEKLFSTVSDSYNDLPKEVWILSGISFINRCGTMVLFFIAIYLSQYMNFDIVTTGRIVGFYGIGAILGSFLGGILTDKKGAFFVQTLSLFCTAICFYSLEHLNSEFSFTIVLFFSGMFFDMIRPANSTAISQYCEPETRVKAFVLERQAINLGNSIGPALGGFLVVYGFHWLFRIDSLTCILAFILLWINFHDKKRTIKHSLNIKKSQSLSSPLKNRAFLIFLAISFLIGICFFQIFSTYPIFMKSHYQLTEFKFGMIMSLNAILIILFEMILANYAKKFDPLRVIGVGAFMMGIGFAILPFNSNYVFAIFAMSIWSIGEMISLPFMSAHIANMANENNRGKYLGIYSSIFTSSLAFAPMIGSLIIDNIGYKALWVSIGVLGIIIWFLLEQIKPESELREK